MAERTYSDTMYGLPCWIWDDQSSSRCRNAGRTIENIRWLGRNKGCKTCFVERQVAITMRNSSLRMQLRGAALYVGPLRMMGLSGNELCVFFSTAYVC